jgi:hypothetical protein
MTDGKTITVEVEFTIDKNSKSTVSQWTFQNRSPTDAKDFVVRHCVPHQATLWRVGLWSGTVDDRPDGGHESGILTTEDDRTQR